jgi:hypothetical protein
MTAAGWTDAFLEMMAVERAAAKNTLAAYGKDLADAQGFLSARGRGLHDAGAEDVEAYFVPVTGHRGSPSGGGASVLSLRPGGRLARRRPLAAGRRPPQGSAAAEGARPRGDGPHHRRRRGA